MTTLIKNILEPDMIEGLQPDFLVLKIIPRNLATTAQFLTFSTPKRKQLQALTTNNHADEVKKLLTQLENKGFTVQVFYTSNEGFERAMKWYDQMESHTQVLAQQESQQQKA